MTTIRKAIRSGQLDQNPELLRAAVEQIGGPDVAYEPETLETPAGRKRLARERSVYEQARAASLKADGAAASEQTALSSSASAPGPDAAREAPSSSASAPGRDAAREAPAAPPQPQAVTPPVKPVAAVQPPQPASNAQSEAYEKADKEADAAFDKAVASFDKLTKLWQAQDAATGAARKAIDKQVAAALTEDNENNRIFKEKSALRERLKPTAQPQAVAPPAKPVAAPAQPQAGRRQRSPWQLPLSPRPWRRLNSRPSPPRRPSRCDPRPRPRP